VVQFGIGGGRPTRDRAPVILFASEAARVKVGFAITKPLLATEREQP